MQAQAQSNAQLAEQTALAETQKQQVLTEQKVQLENAKSQLDIKKMEMEAQIKQQLMQQEFQYNIQLAQAQGQAFEKGLQQYLASQSAAAGGLGNVAGQFGTFGTQLGQAGAGQAGLGFDVQKAGIADASTLLDFANLQQQQLQKKYDLDYANALAQYQRPFTELGFLGSAFGYAPSIPSYTPAGGGGSVSPLQQIIGYGSLGLGALSGLKGIQGLF